MVKIDHLKYHDKNGHFDFKIRFFSKITLKMTFQFSHVHRFSVKLAIFRSRNDFEFAVSVFWKKFGFVCGNW